jgi:hypothetical protein
MLICEPEEREKKEMQLIKETLRTVMAQESDFENGFIFIFFPSFYLSRTYQFYPMIDIASSLASRQGQGKETGVVKEEENWATTSQKKFLSQKIVCMGEERKKEDEEEEDQPPQVRQKRRASERERGSAQGILSLNEFTYFLIFFSFFLIFFFSHARWLASFILSWSLFVAAKGR